MKHGEDVIIYTSPVASVVLGTEEAVAQEQFQGKVGEKQV